MNERYEKNYNYVIDKIKKMSKNQNLQYKDTFEKLLDDQYTQSIEYDFNNNNRNLIKQKAEIKINESELSNNDNKVNLQVKVNQPKITIQEYSSEILQLFNNNYESYNLDLSLQNNFCAAILFVLSDMFRIFNVKEQNNYIKI